jgi:hypothetical protein
VTRGLRLGLALLAAGPLAGSGLVPARAEGPEGALDRRTVVIPPAYPAPPAGTITLPAPPPALVPREPGAQDRPVWVPGQTDLRVGIDPGGRIIQYLQETPSRFRP